MKNLGRSRSSARRMSVQLTAMVMVLGLLLVFTASAFANTVNIYDNAHVLNSSQVRSEASSLSYPLDIYTVANYTNGNSAFDQSTTSKINRSNLIVVAINTTQGYRHVRVDGGNSVSLSSSDYQNAANAFASNYNNGDYSGATVAAIHSLRNALGQSSGGVLPSGGGIGSVLGTVGFCIVGLLILAGIAFFVITRRRNSSGGGFFRNRPMQPPYNPNYNQQQYGGPYNQPYPPNYGNQSGIGPLGAGALGAAGGGLLGYELGKREGEEEGREGNYDRGDNNGGNYGNGGGADFGNNNGGGADFGNNNGGGDFGGGGGADFGGGGGDSGGGGGSNF